MYIFTTFSKIIDAAKKYAEGTATFTGSSGLGTGLRLISLENRKVKGFYGSNVVASHDDNAGRALGQYENSRSNSFIYSQQFEHSGWFKESGSVSSSLTFAPDGTLSADRFYETTDAGNVLHFISQSITSDGSSPYTFSVYARSGNIDSPRNLMLSNSFAPFSSSVLVGYNLEHGIVTSISGPALHAGVEKAGDDWYRCWYSVSALSNSQGESTDFSICLSSGSSAEYSYQGDGTGYISLWNAQIEIGAFPSSPMPTGENQAVWSRYPHAQWLNVRSSLTANAALAPDNTWTAVRCTEDGTASSTHTAYGDTSQVISGSNYCFSVYAKAGERNWVRVLIQPTRMVATAFVYFNLNDGTIGTVFGDPPSYGMDYIGDGWWRCWLSQTANDDGGNPGGIGLADGNNGVTYDGDGESGLYVWNPQWEIGKYPGPPIFTENTAIAAGLATRFQDEFYWGDAITGSLSHLREKFAFKYRPEFNSNMPHSATYIWDFQDSLQEYNTRAFLSSDNYFKIEDQDKNEFLSINSGSLSWSRGNELEFICEPLSGTVELRGFISGNGIYQGDPWSPRDGNIHWGGTSKPVDGVMSEPYNFASKYELADFGTGNFSASPTTRWLAGSSSVAGVVGPILPDAGVLGSYHGRDFGQFEYGAENLLSQSQHLSGSEWSATRAGVSGNLALAPDRTLTADKLVEDSTAANTHLVEQAFIPDGSSTYCMSCYAKAEERTWILLLVSTNGFPASIGVYYNLGDGTIGTSTADDEGIEDVGGGWYRCWFTATSDAAVATNFSVYLAEADADATFDGDGGSGVYLWNTQIEVGDYPSSPILNGENLIDDSEEFTNWLSLDSSVLSNVAIAPNGTLTADKVIEGITDDGPHNRRKNFTPVSGSSYTFSVYAKAAERTALQMTVLTQGYEQTYTTFFDLVNGKVGYVSQVEQYGIEDAGNGWWRCWIGDLRADAAVSTQHRLVLAKGAGGTDSAYRGDGMAGLYLWGAQIEVDTAPGAYVRTGDAAVTTPQPREKDVFFWNDQEISSQMRKKFMLQFVPNYSKTQMSQSLSTLWDFNEFGDNIKFKAQLSSSGELFVSSAAEASSTSYVSASGLDWDRGQALTTIFDPAEGMIKTIGFGTGSQTVWEEPWVTLSGTLYWGMSSSQETQLNGLMTEPLQAPVYPHSVYLDDMVTSSSAERYLSVSGAGVLRSYNQYGPTEFATVTLNDFIFVQSEMSSANVFTKAQQFVDSDWVETRGAVSGNIAIAPDGTLTADKFVMDTQDDTSHYLFDNKIPDGWSPYCFSIYAKAAEVTWFRILMNTNGFPANESAFFDLTNGVVGTTLGPEYYGIDYVGNGWYRCWMTATSDASAGTVFRIELAEDDNDTVFPVGDGVSGIYIWQAQLEKSKFPTSPISRGENIFTYSREFDDSEWDKDRTGISGNLAIAPDGTFTADKLVEDSSDNTHYTSQTITPDGASSYCFSVYAKQVERNWLRLFPGAPGYDGNCSAYFDLSNGVVGTIGAGVDDSGIEDIGDDWYRCWLTCTSDAAAATVHLIGLADADNSPSYQGNGANGLYIWNAQLDRTDGPPGPAIKTESESITVVSRSITKMSASAGSYSRNTLRNQFQVKFIPYFAHDQYCSSSVDPRILSWYEPDAGSTLDLYYSSSLAKFVVTSSGPSDITRVTSSVVTFNRGQEITFIINPANEMLALSGCLTGNGHYYGTGSWIDFLDDSTADLYVGCRGPDFTNQANGLVSLPIITNTPITEKLTMVSSANPFALWHSEYGLVLSDNRVTGWDDQWGYTPATQSVDAQRPFYNRSTKRVEFNSSSGEWLSLNTMSGSPDNWSLVAGLDVRDNVGQHDHLLATENIKFNILGITSSKPGYWTPESGDRQPTDNYTITSSQTMAYVLRSGSFISQIRRNGGSLSGSYDYPVSYSMAGDDSGIGACSGSNASGMHLKFLALYQGALSPADLGYVENLALEEMGKPQSVVNKLAQVTSVEPISLWHAKYGIYPDAIGNVEYWFDQWGNHHGYQPNPNQRPGYNLETNRVLFDATTNTTIPLDFTTPEPSGSYWFVFGVNDTLTGSNPGIYSTGDPRYFETEGMAISLYRTNSGSLVYSSSLNLDQVASSSTDLTGSHVVSFICAQGSSQGKFRVDGQETGDFTYSLASIDGSASLGSRPGTFGALGRSFGRTFDGEIKFAAIYRGEPSAKDQSYVEKIAMDEMKLSSKPIPIAYFKDFDETHEKIHTLVVVSGGVTRPFPPEVLPIKYIGGHRFLQSEDTLTNWLSHSQDFGHADWTKTNCGISASVSASRTTAPDGMLTADKLVEDSSSGSHYIRQNFIPDGSSIYCLSVYAKAAERNWIKLDAGGGGFPGDFFECNYDLTNGVTGSESGATKQGIDNMGNGWYRCWMSLTSDTATSNKFDIILEDAEEGDSYQGDGGSGVYLWGAQAEQQTYPSSPIHTGENFFTFAQHLNENDWDTDRCSISPNIAVAPDGRLTADKVVEDDTAANTHMFYQNFTPDGSSQYCMSCYAKADGRDWLRLTIVATGFPTTDQVYFNVSNGTIGTVDGSPEDYGIEDIGDGWWRCWITATSDAASSTICYFNLAETDDDNTYDGDGVSGIYIWNVQVERAAIPGSPMFTGASTVTGSEYRRNRIKTWWESSTQEELYGRLTWKWIPQEDSATIDSNKTQWYVNETGNVIQCHYNHSNDAIRVWNSSLAAQGHPASDALTFSAHQEITITTDPAKGLLIVSGATSGDGTYKGNPWKNARGYDFYWAGAPGGVGYSNGLMSEPYRDPDFDRD